MITRVISRAQSCSKREQLVLLEIDIDKIDSASGFVDYMRSSYGFSKSSLWYNLNRLKEKGMLDFASREEPGKFLALTRQGLRTLEELWRSGVKLREFVKEAVPNDTDDSIDLAPNFMLSRIITY